jgi:hypothetical protein
MLRPYVPSGNVVPYLSPLRVVFESGYADDYYGRGA